MENQSTLFIDIKRIFQRIKTHKFIFIGVLILSVVLTYVYNRMASKVYKFQATMLLGQDKNNLGNAALEAFTPVQNSQQTSGINVNDEIGKITSFTMVQKMVDKLDLKTSYHEGTEIEKNEIFDKVPFRVVLDTMHVQPIQLPFFVKILSASTCQITIQGSGSPLFDYLTEEEVGELPETDIVQELEFGQQFINDHMSFSVYPANNLDESSFGLTYHFIFHSLENVAENFRNRLTVVPINRNSNIISITTEGIQPQKEVTMINELMTVFRDTDWEEKRQAGRQTLDFIRGKLGEATAKLTSSENAQVNYKAQTNVSTDDLPRQLTQQITQKQSQRDNINNAISLYDRLIQLLDSRTAISTDIISPAAYNVNDPVLNDFFNEQRQFNQEKTQLETYVQKDNPKLRVLDMKIKNSKEQMKTYIQRKRDASFNDLLAAEEQINKLQTDLSKIPSIVRRQDELRREVNYDEEIYQDLMKQENIAEINLANITPDVQILDNAKQFGKSPISPNTTLNYIIALFLGFILPYGFITVKEILDDRIKSQEDLKAATNIPYLGMIIRGDKEETLVFEPNAKSVAAESFRSLRVNLDHQKKLGNGILGFTSTISGEGKTFCSVNLAHAYALSGKKTVLVCADLRKPRIDEYFDGLYEEGLSNYLNQECEIEETIQETSLKNLSVVNAGPTPENPTVILDSERMHTLINYLKENYDQVIIDTPPIGFVSEYFILKSFIDVSIYVVRANYTDKRHLSEVNELFDTKKVRNLNMLLNDVKLPDTHMYYGNSYTNGYTYYE